MLLVHSVSRRCVMLTCHLCWCGVKDFWEETRQKFTPLQAHCLFVAPNTITLSKCLSYHYKKDCIRGTVLLCLASPLGQLIDLFSQFAFLSPCLLLCLAFQFAWLLACLSSSLLTKSTIGFQTKEPAPKQVRSPPKLAAVRIPRFATNDVFFSPTLEVFHKRITSTGAWTPPWNSLERWDTMAFFCRHRIGVPMSWDFAKRLSPPLRAATERRINIVPRITTLLQEAPCGASTRSLPSCHRSGCNKTHQQLPPTG